jgi:nucleotide-binding universal stress UspA family protein
MKLFKPKESPMKLMVCYDASGAADQALRLAQAYAKKWCATIDVVSAAKQEDDSNPETDRKIEETFQSRLKECFQNCGVPYAGYVLIKPFTVAEQLIMFAENRAYDFMFVGISKRSKTGKMLYGSTAQYVILNAPCPVISFNGIGRAF